MWERLEPGSPDAEVHLITWSPTGRGLTDREIEQACLLGRVCARARGEQAGVLHVFVG